MGLGFWVWLQDLDFGIQVFRVFEFGQSLHACLWAPGLFLDPKIYEIMAFMVVITGLGLLFYILFGV